MALDKDEASRLFNISKPSEVRETLSQTDKVEGETVEVKNVGSSEVNKSAKWENMEKTTVFLAPGQKDWLDGIAKKIMRGRQTTDKVRDKERITSNSVLRCLIEAFSNVASDSMPVDIYSEEELSKAIQNECLFWFKSDKDKNLETSEV